jgi:CheY-like chemotaxis protein
MVTDQLHIILADNDESDRLLFKEALEELRIKHVVKTVKDGTELMDYLSKKENPVPSLLFLDLNMPCKNGLQCLKEIRTINKLKNMIIAIFSNSASEKDIDDTFSDGANVYIKKPADFNQLKQALDKVLRAANVYREPPFNIANFVFKV